MESKTRGAGVGIAFANLADLSKAAVKEQQQSDDEAEAQKRKEAEEEDGDSAEVKRLAKVLEGDLRQWEMSKQFNEHCRIVRRWGFLRKRIVAVKKRSARSIMMKPRRCVSTMLS